MCVETLIGLPDQLAIEPFLAATRFIACYEQDCFPFCIEGKGYSPLPISSAEAQLLHIRMAGAGERIHTGTTQLWSELLQQARQCQDFRLHIFVQLEEFRFKLIADFNDPAHPNNMTYSTYDVKYILGV